MAVTPQILNEAMCVYVQTFSRRDRLAAHLTKRGLEQHSDEIFSELDSVLKTAEDHLYNYPGGVPWTEAFERAYQELLIEKHPWLNNKSLGRVFAYSRWLCWHDGLDAKTSTASPKRLRTAAKILRRGGFCLALIGVIIFLVRPQGESEGDDRPITAAIYAVGFLIAGGVAGFIGTVFHHASTEDK